MWLRQQQQQQRQQQQQQITAQIEMQSNKTKPSTQYPIFTLSAEVLNNSTAVHHRQQPIVHVKRNNTQMMKVVEITTTTDVPSTPDRNEYTFNYDTLDLNDVTTTTTTTTTATAVTTTTTTTASYLNVIEINDNTTHKNNSNFKQTVDHQVTTETLKSYFDFKCDCGNVRILQKNINDTSFCAATAAVKNNSFSRTIKLPKTKSVKLKNPNNLIKCTSNDNSFKNCNIRPASTPAAPSAMVSAPLLSPSSSTPLLINQNHFSKSETSVLLIGTSRNTSSSGNPDLNFSLELENRSNSLDAINSFICKRLNQKDLLKIFNNSSKRKLFELTNKSNGAVDSYCTIEQTSCS